MLSEDPILRLPRHANDDELLLRSIGRSPLPPLCSLRPRARASKLDARALRSRPPWCLSAVITGERHGALATRSTSACAVTCGAARAASVTRELLDGSFHSPAEAVRVNRCLALHFGSGCRPADAPGSTWRPRTGPSGCADGLAIEK